MQHEPAIIAHQALNTATAHVVDLLQTNNPLPPTEQLKAIGNALNEIDQAKAALIHRDRQIRDSSKL